MATEQLIERRSVASLCALDQLLVRRMLLDAVIVLAQSSTSVKAELGDLETVEGPRLVGIRSCSTESMVGDPEQDVAAGEHATVGGRQLDGDLVVTVVDRLSDRLTPGRSVGEGFGRGVDLARPVGRGGRRRGARPLGRHR